MAISISRSFRYGEVVEVEAEGNMIMLKVVNFVIIVEVDILVIEVMENSYNAVTFFSTTSKDRNI